MRRRRNQPDARRRVPRLRDPRIHLVPRKLTALARLGALRHLDLQLVGVDQILAGHAESPRGDLLDRAALRVAVGERDVALGILAAFAGVRLPAHAVHRDGERLVRLLADRAVRHRAGREPLDDRVDRLDVLERHLRPGRLQPEQAAQRRAALVLDVNGARVLLEDRVLPAARGVLQLEHRVRVEQVVLAVAAPLILAARLELLRPHRLPAERARVADRALPRRRCRCRRRRCATSCA